MLTIGSKIVFMSDLVKRYIVVTVYMKPWPALLVIGRRPDISAGAMRVKDAQSDLWKVVGGNWWVFILTRMVSLYTCLQHLQKYTHRQTMMTKVKKGNGYMS